MTKPGSVTTKKDLMIPFDYSAYCHWRCLTVGNCPQLPPILKYTKQVITDGDIKFNYIMQLKKLLITGTLFAVSTSLFAATTATLLPTAEGTYLQWTPKSGSTHYTMVDETTCNGTTDYVSTTVTGKRDSYQVSLSSVPDGSTITNIAVTPCASKNKSSGSSVMNMFYRLNGANSADQGAYSLTGTTPTSLATTNFSSLSIVKASSTALQVGAVYASGTGGARLSRVATVITYTPPVSIPSAPTNLNSFSSSTNIILNWTDTSSNEDGFWIERSTDGTNFSFLATTTFANYFNSGLATGTYYYKVRAYNTAGNSAFSSTTVAVIP